MPSGKREAAAYWGLYSLAAAQPQEVRMRRTASEDYLGALRSRMGSMKTSTIEEQLGLTGPAQFDLAGGKVGDRFGGEDYQQEGSIFQLGKARSGAAGRFDPRYGGQAQGQNVYLIDKYAALKQMEGSVEGQIVDTLMSESKQLLDRKGPAWDAMLQATQLPIIEGAAAMQRESMENLRKARQRGGSAWRSGQEWAAAAMMQHKTNTMKIQELTANSMKLNMWARDNARTNVEFMNSWTANTAGVRETYQTAMDGASELMASKSLPLMFAAVGKAAEWRYRAHQKNRDSVNRWITGALGVASAVAGMKMGSAEMVGGGISAIGQSFGGTDIPSAGTFRFGS